jgi:hypothetical protein
MRETVDVPKDASSALDELAEVVWVVKTEKGVV